MAFSSENYESFFSKSPFLKKEEVSSPFSSHHQYQNLSFDQYHMQNLGSGRVYQPNYYRHDDMHDSNNYHKMAINSTYSQRRPPFKPQNVGYSSMQQFDLSANETLDEYIPHLPHHDTRDSTQIYSEEEEDRPEGPILMPGSKKIHKGDFKGKLSKKNQLLKSKTKRNPWQPEEDEQVIDLVLKYGQSWALIASLMKDRSGKQIRDRYLNKLKPNINKTEWTASEDETVMTLCKEMGNKWSKIATYLPGRTEGQVKNRFYSHIKKRMAKWTGSKTATDKIFDEDSETDSQGCRKEISTSFSLGLNQDQKLTKIIPTLNSAGDYKIINSVNEKAVLPQLSSTSININLKPFNPLSDPSGRKGVTFSMVPNGKLNKDPTDVISYLGVNKENSNSIVEEQLNSTRAPSLEQNKEFDDLYDKMAVQLTNAPAKRLHGISFSISNGNIFQNTAKAVEEPKTLTIGGPLIVKNLKESSQMSLAGSQNRINIKIC